MNRVLVLRHEPSVSMGSLAYVLGESGLEPVCLDLFENVPAGLPWSEAAGLIILGGTMSANDGDLYPFLQAELDWIREAIRRETPLLGLCLGSQLIARALGSRVYRNHIKEIGWYEVELRPEAADDPLFHDRGPRETVFQWHHETFDLPQGAVHLASGARCRNQAFRVGRAAYGVQFHAEMTPELMNCWLSDFQLGEASRVQNEILATTIRREAVHEFVTMNSFSRCLLGRFARLCRQGPI